MRVIVNGLPALERKTGIGHYIVSTHEAMAEVSPETRVDLYPGGSAAWAIKKAKKWVFAPRKSTATLDATGGPATSSGGAGRLLRGAVAGVRWKDLLRDFARKACHKHFLAQARNGGHAVYHEPNFIPWPAPIPVVNTVHDLSVLVHPEWHPADRVRVYEKYFYRAMRWTDRYLTGSEFTRNQMVGMLGISADKIDCAGYGIRSNFRPLAAEQIDPVLARLGLNRGYYLHVGTVEPRKNLLTLMRAYVRLPVATRRRRPLVLVGGWGWRAKEVFDYFDTVAKPAGARHLGYTPEADLPALFNGARALAIPSFYEGFGLPAAEMMACGGEVLASTADALREAAGGRGHFIDPHDEDAWTAGLRQMDETPDPDAAARAANIRQASRWDWKTVARGTLESYRRAAG